MLFRSHAEEEIRAALVKLAGKLAVAHVELEQRVARRERHLAQLAHIPCANDVPTAVGILLNLRDDLVNLVDGAAIGRAPVAPLRAIDTTESLMAVNSWAINARFSGETVSELAC